MIKRRAAREIASFLLMLGALYFGINWVMGAVLQTDSPLMAVTSNSMKHYDQDWRAPFLDRGLDPSKFPIQGGFERGDLLVVRGVRDPKSEISVGDVIVYEPSKGAFITHRVLDVTIEDGDLRYVAKGDSNRRPDMVDGKIRYIKPEEMVGKVIFVIPKLGYISLWFQSG